MERYRGYYLRAIGLLLTALLATRPVAAQLPTGSLAGVVRDSASHAPVAYATVAWLPGPPTPSLPVGTTTDAQGRFALPHLAAGPGRLRVSFVGYAPAGRLVTIGTEAIMLAPIELVPATQQLAEAVVVGIQPLVEVGPDRLLYHASQDVNNAGGTAQDVLRKTPLLAVDGAGNVTLRGSANFKVLVNSQPAPALAQNLAQALKSLPADQIERVEVLTTPSARYEGEGTAGIVNIVLKKGTRRPLNGRLGASGGNRASELTAALGGQRGKFALNATAGAGSWYEPDQLTRRRLGFSPLGTDTLTQSGRRQTSGTWYTGSVGLDYDPAPHHRLSLLGTLGGYQVSGRRDLLTRFASSDAALNQLFTRATTDYGGSTNAEATGTYVRTFAQARREWSVLAQYARSTGTFGYDFDQYTNSAVALALPLADYRERSRGRTPSQELTAQTDFTQPFGEKNTLEMGLKTIFRRTGAVATVEGQLPGLAPGPAPDFVPLAGRDTDYRYAQDVQAAYATYAAALGKRLAASLGGRVERTAYRADFRASGTALPPRSYRSLLPSGSLRYTWRPDTSSLRLAYSRRITRPYIDYLNPFVDRSNPQNVSYGNPDLAPELTDAYELSYQGRVHALPVVLSGTVRHTGQAIEAVRLPTATAGVTAQTFANVAATTYYQLTLYATARPLPGWELSGGPNAQYAVLLSPELDRVRRGFTAGFSADTSYHLPHQLTAQASAAAALPAPTLQGQGPASLYYAVGLKKTVLREQADLTLNVANPFTESFPNRSTVTTAFLDERTEYRTYQRAIRLSFNYRFGQDGPERAHRKASDDDLKGR